MFALLAISVFPAGMIIAAFNDIYEFKIPNWVSVALLIAYFTAGLALGVDLRILFEGFVLACVSIVLGFGLFVANVLGGGDAKLLAATAPWVGLGGLGPFLFNVALAGGGLAIFLIVFRKTPALPVYAHAPWLLRLHQRPKDIPYAVAIATGGLLSFPQIPYFTAAFGG